MTSFDPFFRSLEALPLLRNIGQPIPDSSVPRLPSWDAWPGPFDPLVEVIHTRQADLRDRLLAASPKAAELAPAFDELVNAVVALVRDRVPFDPNEDSWHAPTTAVWYVAWTAALVWLSDSVGEQIGPELAAQWHWFGRGHWPAAIVSTHSSAQAYVVY